MGTTLPSGFPRITQPVQLDVTAHERRLGGREVLAVPAVAVRSAIPELLVYRVGCFARRYIKLALEHRRAPVVGAQRSGSVTKRQMGCHLDSSRRFVGRFQVDDAFGMRDRGFVVPAPCRVASQSNERSMRLGSKLSSLVQDPIVVTGRKEIARIETRGKLQITRRNGVSEPEHVNDGRTGRDPTHCLVVDLDELTDVGKRMTEVVQQLSEVCARLAFVGVGPELEREM